MSEYVAIQALVKRNTREEIRRQSKERGTPMYAIAGIMLDTAIEGSQPEPVATNGGIATMYTCPQWNDQRRALLVRHKEAQG